jgi:hypothetical protein
MCFLLQLVLPIKYRCLCMDFGSYLVSEKMQTMFFILADNTAKIPEIITNARRGTIKSNDFSETGSSWQLVHDHDSW